jgi:SSS family solute:Na+ symporter
VPKLVAVDWLILLLYFVYVLGLGFSRRLTIKTGADFLLAGRTQPAWFCGLAFLAAGLGLPGVLAMGAAGAGFGLRSAPVFLIGAIPAMLFVGFYMMPLYYGSRARSVPEFLGLRFDGKTRLLSAVSFALMAFAAAAVSLYLVARLFQALHVFDELFFALGWSYQAIPAFALVLAAALVLAYVLLGGLSGVLRNHMLQVFVLVAGFLPVTFLGLKNIGGWSGLSSSAFFHGFQASAHSGAMAPYALVLALGLLLGAGYWCTDFRVLQAAFVAKDMKSARRVPLIAAALCLVLPLLLTLPGVIAIGLPTPHSTTVVSEENGVIYHRINVVPRASEAGQGLVPARLDPATNNAMRTADGRAQLDYGMASPNMLASFLPTGLLGLGLAALLACLMSGLAASVTAFNTVFTYDLYQPLLGKEGSSGKDANASDEGSVSKKASSKDEREQQPLAAQAAEKLAGRVMKNRLVTKSSLVTGHDLSRAEGSAKSTRPLGPVETLTVARWAAVGFVMLSAAAALALVFLNKIGSGSSNIPFDGTVAALLLIISVVNLPQFAVLLLGMFSKRSTGHGAFAGLLAGAAAALLHHGLTLPAASYPGLCGGWIAPLYRYPTHTAQIFGTAILAFTVSLFVAALVSLSTPPRPEKELTGLVRSLMRKPKSKRSKPFSQRG